MGCSASVHKNQRNDAIHPQSQSASAEEPRWTGVGVSSESNRRAEGNGTRPRQVVVSGEQQNRNGSSPAANRQTRGPGMNSEEGPGRQVSFEKGPSSGTGASGDSSDHSPVSSPPKPSKSHTMPYIEVMDDSDRSVHMAASTETAPYLSTTSDAAGVSERGGGGLVNRDGTGVVFASASSGGHRASSELSDAPLVQGLEQSTGERPPMLPTSGGAAGSRSQEDSEQRSQGMVGVLAPQVGSWSGEELPMPSPHPTAGSEPHGQRNSMSGALMSNRSDSPAYNSSLQEQSWKMPPGASGVSYGNMTSASVNSGFSATEPPPAFWAQYFEKNSRAVAQALKDLEVGLPNGAANSQLLTGSQRQKIEGWVAETPSPPPAASGVPPLAPHTHPAATAAVK